jgi:hypothetical protein
MPYFIMPSTGMVQPGNTQNQPSRGNESNKKDSEKEAN